MMSMSQQEEKRTSLFEEEEETESSPKKNMQAAPRRTGKEQPVKKDRKYYMKRFIGVLCAAVLAVTVRTAYNNSTLFLEDRSAEGYLSAEDYVFYQDGEAMQNVRSISFQDDYISQYSDEGVTTSRGITYGDSWEDFVKAYGDVRCEYVWYHRVLKDGSNNYSFDETQFPETDGMKISDFDKKYIQSGQIDLNENNMTVVFCVDYGGNQLYYTPKERDEFLDEYYSSWHEMMHTFQRCGSFRLYFDFVPPGMYDDLPEGGISDISSYNYR